MSSLKLTMEIESKDEILSFIKYSEDNAPLIKPRENFIKKFLYSDPKKLFLYAKENITTLIGMKKYLERLRTYDEKLQYINTYFMICTVLRNIENCN